MPFNLESHSVPVGCEHCYYTGFSGRKAIYELIPMETEVSQSIRDNKMDVQEIKSLKQLKFLKEAAWELFATQQTAIDEVFAYFI